MHSAWQIINVDLKKDMISTIILGKKAWTPLGKNPEAFPQLMDVTGA